jgi:hypothetical protein
MASFAELKVQRERKEGASVQSSPAGKSASSAADSNNGMHLGTLAASLLNTTADSTTPSVLSNSIYKLDNELLEIRETPDAGRGLFAKKRISPGTVILHRTPHVALLDKEHLAVLCSNCMRDTGKPLKRCSGCAAVWYCSTVSGACNPL